MYEGAAMYVTLTCFKPAGRYSTQRIPRGMQSWAKAWEHIQKCGEAHEVRRSILQPS